MEKATHRIRFLKPAAGLKDVVRFYVQREAQLRGHDLVHPVPARAAPMLEFIFSEPFEIHWCERPLVETTPRPVLIGLQTSSAARDERNAGIVLHRVPAGWAVPAVLSALP